MREPQNTDDHLEELNKVMMEWYKKGHFDNIPNEMYLLKVIADIRQKTGIGDKVMLTDLADTLARLIQNGESAIETNKQLVKKLTKAEKYLEDGVIWVYSLGEEFKKWPYHTPLDGGIRERFRNLSMWALSAIKVRD